MTELDPAVAPETSPTPSDDGVGPSVDAPQVEGETARGEDVSAQATDTLITPDEATISSAEVSAPYASTAVVDEVNTPSDAQPEVPPPSEEAPALGEEAPETALSAGQTQVEETSADEMAEEPLADEVVDVADAADTAESAAPVADAQPGVASTPRTAARAIAEHLHAAGARYAFTVPGESFLGLLDALDEVGIRVVATRHENGASFMAEAASQLTAKPQLVLGTRAVGAANMSIGIHTARADSSPMIALVGQVRREWRGREAFQEVDQAGSFGRIAKWGVEIDDPARADSLTAEAITRATGGRPGPVLIAIPEDVLDAESPGTAPTPQQSRATMPDPDTVKAIIKVLASAQRGAILAGVGVLRSNASRRLMRLAEALGVPVFSSWRRPDAFPNGHPLYLGMAGLAGAPTVLARLQEADVLLVLGSRLSEMTTFDYTIPSPSTRWMHVDLEPGESDRARPAPEIALASDAGRFVDAALSLLRAGVIDAQSRDVRLQAAARDRDAYLAAIAAPAEVPWDGPGVHPGRIVATMNRILTPESIVTSDAGNFAGWLMRSYRFRRPGTFLGPTSGAMGYGLPAAIAAAMIYPRRQVVAVAGDGGFAMTMNEVETAVREGLAPVTLVFDNNLYGTIAMHQGNEGRKHLAVDLGPIDFAAVARAQGAHGVSVSHDDEFGDALTEALAGGRPAVIHLALDQRWVSVDRPPSSAAPVESGSMERNIATAP